MDLIFANANFTDQGVLQDYYFDMEYGIGEKDTNTFECTVQKYNPAVTGENDIEPIGQDSIIYAENTDYGGIVDRLETNVKSGTVTFKGRTWHGVLNSYVLEPEEGLKYRSYYGNANDIISQMLEDVGLNTLFVVDPDELYPNVDLIPIESFNIRYEKVYDAIIRMITTNNRYAKLIMYFYNGQVHLRALMAVNYATNEEWDSSQTPFEAGKTFNGTNHLVCLGQGEGENRAVIHLFMDEQNRVMPYKQLEEVEDPTGNPWVKGYFEFVNDKYIYTDDRAVVPGKTYYQMITVYQDSDFILDKSEMVYSGIEERAEIYDFSSAEIRENYLRQETEPSDWLSNYTKKYYYKDGSEYKLFEEDYRDEFILQTEKPNGWDDATIKAYQDYYYQDTSKTSKYIYKEENNIPIYVKARDGDKNANSYEWAMAKVKEASASSSNVRYNLLHEPPREWESTYGDYYIANGLTPSGDTNYEKVKGVNYTTYGKNAEDGTEANIDGHPLESEPVDFWHNYAHFYYREQMVPLPPPGTSPTIYNYYHCKEVEEESFEMVKSKSISGWANKWSEYYIKVKAATKGGKSTAMYISAQDAIETGDLKYAKGKSYPQYKAKKYYKRTVTKRAPLFAEYYPPTGISIEGGGTTIGGNGAISSNGVFESFSHTRAPVWEDNKYYEAIGEGVPTWQPNTYYTMREDKLQLPAFDSSNTYYQVLDRLSALTDAAVEKLIELNDQDTLNIDLELNSNYDVGDVFGVHDEVTGIEVVKTILRKIIRIKENIVSVEYAIE